MLTSFLWKSSLSERYLWYKWVKTRQRIFQLMCLVGEGEESGAGFMVWMVVLLQQWLRFARCLSFLKVIRKPNHKRMPQEHLLFKWILSVLGFSVSSFRVLGWVSARVLRSLACHVRGKWRSVLAALAWFLQLSSPENCSCPAGATPVLQIPARVTYLGFILRDLSS